ncbi:hypothetical protein KGF86_07555 [Ornithinibacillus massiliensis]|uniref:Flagellar hook-length control protein FliK n=1 Tax=Ornithinibacillus massiliensis TaxID=1944633 RepID=A0ABS5MCL4_9BACI|nr:hypothetical protein [Ornithinibacillus massiliensis]MBS3680066.1 hypothetical protein [Ornithinibacillus massiliensis]
MNIQDVLGKTLTNSKEPVQTLRLGQIVQGRILKLYPNNKAHIQLGVMQLIAQLEAPLEIGNNYHFQVQALGQVAQLKVIAESPTNPNRSELPIIHLLQQLGINPTKIMQEFVKVLMQEKIPFEKGQLQNSYVLLESASNKEQAQALLKEMIVSRMPINDSVFQALFASKFGSFTNQLESLDSVLRQNLATQPNINNGLVSQINQLTGNTNQIPVKQIIPLLNSPELVYVLKASGMIDQDIPFRIWNNRVIQNADNGLMNLNQLFTTNTVKELQASISKLEVIQQHASSLLTKWENLLQQSVTNNVSISEENFTNLKREVELSTLPFTLKHGELRNHPQSLRVLLHHLATLSNQENYSKVDSFLHHFIKESFVQQTKTILEDMGIQYEKAILKDETNPSNSLKGMLLQLIQSSDGTILEQGTKLLHVINGIQLQSYSESDKMIQANLLLPGGRIGLDSDIALNFEGKKTEAGEINPDYCRIVFFLELANLEQTVIDMNIQKRSISITVLNDQPIEGITQSLKPLLKEGLEKLEYYLSNVSVKPLTNQENVAKNSKPTYQTKQQASYQGVDFRI